MRRNRIEYDDAVAEEAKAASTEVKRKARVRLDALVAGFQARINTENLDRARQAEIKEQHRLEMMAIKKKERDDLA